MFAFTIDQVADIVGLERQRNSSRECSFNVRCPICRDKHYKLNIDRTKGVWRCAKCDAHGGTLDLYVRFGMGLGADECNKATRYRAKKEIMDMLKLSLNEPVRKLPIVYEDDHTVLSDTELHTVYSALLKIPALRLRYEHYKQLIERGLTDDYIMCNEYRSIPDRLYLPKGKKETMSEFRSGQIYMLCRENSRFKRMGQKNIISGIYIGMYLTEQGINLDGVPGFFKLLGLAIISCIVSVATAIITRDAAALALIVVSVFFALTALKLSYDYANGSIIGYSLLCLSVTPKNGSFTVVFEDEELATYVFVHYSKKKEFFEDVKYEFYTHKNTPKTIIAFEQI